MWHLYKVAFDRQRWASIEADPSAALPEIQAQIADLGGQFSTAWPDSANHCAMLWVEGPPHLNDAAAQIAEVLGGEPRAHTYSDVPDVAVGQGDMALSADRFNSVLMALPTDEAYTCDRCGHRIVGCPDHAPDCPWRTLCH